MVEMTCCRGLGPCSARTEGGMWLYQRKPKNLDCANGASFALPPPDPPSRAELCNLEPSTNNLFSGSTWPVLDKAGVELCLFALVFTQRPLHPWLVNY